MDVIYSKYQRWTLVCVNRLWIHQHSNNNTLHPCYSYHTDYSSHNYYTLHSYYCSNTYYSLHTFFRSIATPSHEHILVKELFKYYDPTVRPRYNSSHTVNVRVRFSLQQINDLVSITIISFIATCWSDTRESNDVIVLLIIYKFQCVNNNIFSKKIVAEPNPRIQAL